MSMGRIESISEFYGSGLVNGGNLIMEELKCEILSSDARGKWALQQLENAAETLRVLKFVKPLDKGGVIMPEIAILQRYLVVFSGVGLKLIKSLEDTFAVRESHQERTYLDMVAADNDMRMWDAVQLSATPPTEPDQLKEWKLSNKRKEECKDRCEETYNKWQSVHSELQKDRQRVEEWQESAARKAEKQRAEDIDALARVKRSLDTLKKFLQGLMVRVPEIESVVRKMSPEYIDPFTAGDLRVVYGNLLARFRNGDQMGVTTTLIGGMRLSQAVKQPLDLYMRKVEEFHQAMVFLGVTEISIADLAAMVALGGMHEEHKVAFLESETTVALTMKNMEVEDEGVGVMGGDSSSVASRRSGDKRNLLEKVLDFCHGHEMKKLLVGSMSLGAGNAGSGDKDAVAAEQKREQRKRDLEARSVMSINDGVKLSPMERLANGQCYRHKEGRVCKYGEYCKYAHGVAPITGAVVKEVPSAVRPVNSVSESSASRVLFSEGRRNEFTLGYSSDEEEE